MERQPHLLLALALAASGCAPSLYQPQVNLAGMDAARYEVDLRDCRAVADAARFGPLLAGALQGVAIGAGLGTAIGAFSAGNVGLSATYGGLSGVVAGGAVGEATAPARAPTDEKRVVDECLRNNGYAVKS